MGLIPESEGRNAFGENPNGYDASRPDYPAWMFDVLADENCLFRNAATLEIGSGNGIATRKLIDAGVSPLTLIEPDDRFAPLLGSLSHPTREAPRIIYQSFEDADLPQATFDLIVIATAFHWLDPKTRVEKLANLAKKGGSVVLLWNVFQDLNLEDPFHEATKNLLAPLSHSPSGKPDGLPFALDRSAREAEFLSTKVFAVSMYLESHWKTSLDPTGVRLLYESFPQIARLPDAERWDLLDRIESVARTEFSGVVERNMTTPMYVFQRV